MFFSPTTGGFYDRAVHGSAIPADAVAITSRRHARLLSAQAAGGRIVADGRGRPRLVHPSGPRIEDRRSAAIAAVKREAHRRILTIAPLWRQLNDMAEAHLMTLPELAARDARREAVRAIRAASDAIEAILSTMTAGGLAAFSARDDRHWPAPETFA